MVHFVAIVKRWGNSLAIVIPRKDTKKIGLGEGRKVVVELKPKERVNGFGICRGAKPFKEERAEHKEFW